MNLYAIIFDIAAILLVVLAIYSSAKKGFVNSLVFTIGMILSAFIAFFFSSYIGEWIYNAFIKNNILAKIMEVVSSATGGVSPEAAVTSILSAIPSFLSGNAQISEQIQKIVSSSNGLSPANIAGAVEASVVAPIIISIITVISFAVLFSVFMILSRLVAKSTTSMNKIPIIGTINSVLGGLLGLLKGGIIVVIILFVMNFIITVSADSLTWMNTKIIDNTYLLKWIYGVFF